MSDEESITFGSPKTSKSLFQSPAKGIIERGSDPKTSKMADETAPKLTYELNGITYSVQPDEDDKKVNNSVYKKDDRKDLKGKDRIDFIAMIQAKQQQLFHAVTVSKSDPEKLTNTHSVAKLLEEHRRNLSRYDLLSPYTIVIPAEGAFDQTGNSFGKLKLDKDGLPITYDLHKDYLRLTSRQVAASSRWYFTCIPTDKLLKEDLLWSASYYEKNVEPALYSTVHAKWMDYGHDERGGPLFLKLLLDQITTTSEANLKALIFIVETYNIKSSCPGEDVDKVVSMFRSIFNNISALKSDLPTDSVRNLLKIFQTTSVTEFNELFEQMEKQLNFIEIQRTVDDTFIHTLNATGATVLGNDMKSIGIALAFAEKSYRNLVQRGEWDAVLQAIPGRATLIANSQQAALTATNQPVEFQRGTTPEADGILPWSLGKCFNCGGDHRLQHCPKPRDKARIDANRAKHPNGKHKVPSKFRPPEDGENNKRVIDGKPHTWHPKVGPKGWWIEDKTPEDGQPNKGGPPQVLTNTLLRDPRTLANLLQSLSPTSALGSPTGAGSLAASSISGGSSIPPNDDDASMRKLQSHFFLEQLRAALDGN